MERESYKNNFKQHLLVNFEVFLVPLVQNESAAGLVPLVQSESAVAFDAVASGVGVVLVMFTPQEDLTKDWLRHAWEGNQFPSYNLRTKVCA
jgi:hypothetical protein